MGFVTRPRGSNIVSCRWVYTLKYFPDGTIHRHKACLVARGFSQQYAIDYEDTFSPMVRMCSVRIIVSMAVKLDWPLHQLDVSNAFLYGDLIEEVYMEQPPGYVGIGDHSKVFRLRRAIYGLKQSLQAWFTKFSELIRCQGFSACEVEPTVFQRSTTSGCVVLAVYVDEKCLLLAMTWWVSRAPRSSFMLIWTFMILVLPSTSWVSSSQADLARLSSIRASMSLTFSKTWGFSGASLIPRPSRVVPTSGTPPLLYSRIPKSIDAWSGSLFISRSLVQTLPIR